MARIRTVKPEFFHNEELAMCSPHARLLAIALLHLADSEGRMRWIPMQIHAHAFPFEKNLDVSELASELTSAGYLKVDGDAARIIGWKIFSTTKSILRPDLSTSKWRRTRKRIFSRDGMVCAYCGTDCSENPTIDHVRPVSKGGEIYDESNLVVACVSCNSSKKDR